MSTMAKRWNRALVAALMLGGVAFVAGCSGGGGQNQTECGEGTKLENGECVVKSSGCGPGTTLQDGTCQPSEDSCGDNTMLDNMTGKCVAKSNIECGAGTEQKNGECVPTRKAEEACGDGMMWDAQEERCKLADAACGDGTTLDASTGKCVAGNQCESGQVLDGGKCVEKSKLCTGDTWFNEDIGLCVSSNVISSSCQNPKTLKGKKTKDTMLPAGNCYNVEGTLKIKDGARLTIQKGVRLAFKDAAGLKVKGSGVSLVAKGTKDKPILMTGTKKKKGHWNGIFLQKTQSTSNELTHTVVEYAGESAWDGHPEGAALTFADFRDPSVRLTIQNSTIRKNKGYGLSFSDEIKTSFFQDFKNNKITKNELGAARIPVWMAGIIDSGSRITGNGKDRIVVFGSKLEQQQVWEDHGVPYRVTSTFKLDGSGSLELKPGVDLEFEAGTGIGVNNPNTSIVMDGTSQNPIELKGTKPNSGHWKGLFIQRTQNSVNKLHHVTIQHAGSSSWDGHPTGAALTLADFRDPSVDLEIQSSTFKNNGGYALMVSDEVKASGLSGFQNNTFKKNAEGAARVPPWIPDVFDSNSTLKGNAKDRIAVFGGEVAATRVWRDFDVPYRVQGKIEVQGSKGSLEFKPGVTVKFEQSKGIRVDDEGAALRAKGTSSNPITFTATRKVKGYWPGIWFEKTSSPLNLLEHVTISYAGGPPWSKRANLTLYDDGRSNDTTVGISLNNVTLSNSLKHGVFISDDDDPDEINIRSCSNVTFSSNGGTDIGGAERQNWVDSCGSP